MFLIKMKTKNFFTHDEFAKFDALHAKLPREMKGKGSNSCENSLIWLFSLAICFVSLWKWIAFDDRSFRTIFAVLMTFSVLFITKISSDESWRILLLFFCEHNDLSLSTTTSWDGNFDTQIFTQCTTNSTHFCPESVLDTFFFSRLRSLCDYSHCLSELFSLLWSVFDIEMMIVQTRRRILWHEIPIKSDFISTFRVRLIETTATRRSLHDRLLLFYLTLTSESTKWCFCFSSFHLISMA